VPHSDCVSRRFSKQEESIYSVETLSSCTLHKSRENQMKTGVAPAVDRGELIKWYDALEVLAVRGDGEEEFEAGLQMARECQHPDAQWLAALFPAGVAVTQEHMCDVMRAQGDDPRALLLLWTRDEDDASDERLLRAARMGYAPAQTEVYLVDGDDDALVWLMRAAAQGYRAALRELALCFLYGWGCAANKPKAVELFKEAAELGSAIAMYRYGELAFAKLDWERFFWWGCSVSHGVHVNEFVDALQELLPLFETAQHGRILHTVAPVVRKGLSAQSETLFDNCLRKDELDNLERVLVLHDAMLERARRAIACWSVVGRRCGVAKDVRVLIAKGAWEEVWRW
jgi:hypothetical protein